MHYYNITINLVFLSELIFMSIYVIPKVNHVVQSFSEESLNSDLIIVKE